MKQVFEDRPYQQEAVEHFQLWKELTVEIKKHRRENETTIIV